MRRCGSRYLIDDSGLTGTGLAFTLGGGNDLVCRAADVERAIKQTLEKYGRIDAVHNNAGIASPSKPLHETSDEEWQRLMDVIADASVFLLSEKARFITGTILPVSGGAELGYRSVR